jgi:hypothetical protein
MIRLFVLLAISFAVNSIHPAPKSAQVSDRDVAVFRAVIRAGLIPEPTVGDSRVNLPGVSVESRTDVPAPAVVSQTLRLCREPGRDVRCVPEGAMHSIQVNAVADAAEIEELTDANALARSVPADLILTVPYDHVFRGARSWSDVWPSWRNDRKVPECVQFTTPAYISGAAVVYAQRIWNGRVYGWFVRLAADGSQWRVETKRIVWASHPSA